MVNRLKFVLLLTALTALSSGCQTRPKGVLVAFPDYFEIPAGTELDAPLDFGNGPKPTRIKTTREMGCYSTGAQVDVMSVKKGVK
jgi:hypothetical protein